MIEQRSTTARVLLPVLRGWRMVAAVLVTAWVVVAVVLIVRGYRYRAEATVSTVSSARALPTGLSRGLAASVLGLNQGGGVQLTPGVVVRIARLDGVLFAVGQHTIGSRRIVDLLANRKPDRPVPAQRVARTMRQRTSARFDVQTGLITIAVVHKDSALARAVVERLIETASGVFREASRAQASQIGAAQSQRVDSAARRLRAAEEALAQFAARNRVVAQYTPEYVRVQELERVVEASSAVYIQALADQDEAWAKQLEETPVVVVIDPPAPELPREPRGLGLRLLMVTIVVVVLMWVLLIGATALRRLVERPEPAEASLAEALLALPGARWWLRGFMALAPEPRGNA